MKIPFIVVDLERLQELKIVYLKAMEVIQEDYPKANLSSPKSIVQYLKDRFDITVENAKISTINQQLLKYDSDSEEYCLILGITYFLKLKFSVQNYINCIFRHQQNGVVAMRLVNNVWKFPNKQPISLSPEIIDCIITASEINLDAEREKYHGSNS